MTSANQFAKLPRARADVVAVASGMVAGESIVGVGIAAATALGWIDA